MLSAQRLTHPGPLDVRVTRGSPIRTPPASTSSIAPTFALGSATDTAPRRIVNVKITHVTMIHALLLAITCVSACPKPPEDTSPVSGFTDGPADPTSPDPTSPPPPPVLECPGETQCPCTAQASATVDDSGGVEDGCPGPVLVCGPMGACTSNCAFDSHCTSGASGEACIGGGDGVAGHCAIVCNPEVPHGGCPKSGDLQMECMLVLGTNVCGYPTK